MAEGTSEYADALLAVATELGLTLAAPAAALLTARQHVEPHNRPWLAQLSEAARAVVVDLDADGARDAGLLCAASGNPDAHPALAHAALVGIQRSWPVVTTVPDSVLALSSDVRTETIP
jgi:hypothetical protein